MPRLIHFFSGLVLATAGAVQAQDVGFDPRQPCGQILRSAGDTQKMLVAAWVFGYSASAQSDVRPVDFENMGTVLRNVFEACARDEQASLLALVDQSASGDRAGPGSEADAVALLNGFLDPGADLIALTAELAPTEDDILSVYGEPLAGKLIAMYAQMFTPGARIGPKPGQTALIVVRDTTGALQRGDAVLRDFPGGYEEVRPYFVADVPIVRFKFVPPGETLGLAFDGLVHVNGRWVLMPKPWRALD